MKTEWTVLTIKEHFEAVLDEKDKALKAALVAVKEKNDEAAIATEKRFDGVNEFRRTLSDQTATFINRPEYSVQHKALEDRLSAVSDRLTLIEGQTKGGQITVGKIYAAITAAVGLITLIVLFANRVL